MLPPLGAIIIGPCPECQGMVVVFCGRVLPLDKELMTDGSVEERQDHLIEVLGGFLHERIQRLFENQSALSPSVDMGGEDQSEEPLSAGKISPFGYSADTPIVQEELDSFVNVDLKLIDNSEYFKAVFD